MLRTILTGCFTARSAVHLQDKAANIEVARASIEEAAAPDVKLVVLPECWNSPYATSSFPVYAETVPEVGATVADLDGSKSPCTKMMCEVAKQRGIYLIGGSIPERDGDAVYNTCVVVSPDGTVIGKHRKVHLFDIDVPGGITFKESDTLTAGDAVTVFETPFAKIGVGICYDIRFPEQTMLMRNEGVDMVVFPGAFNMTTGPAHWELLQRARAVDNQVYVAAVSPARNPDSSYQAWGHSTLVGPWGDVLATCEHDPAIVVADVDVGRAAEIRQNIPVSKQKRKDMYSLNKA